MSYNSAFLCSTYQKHNLWWAMFIMCLSPQSSDWTPSRSSCVWNVSTLYVCLYVRISPNPTAQPWGFTTQALSSLTLPLCLKRQQIPWTSSVAWSSHTEKETSTHIHSALQHSSWLILSKMTNKKESGSADEKPTHYTLWHPLYHLFIDYILFYFLIAYA